MFASAVRSRNKWGCMIQTLQNGGKTCLPTRMHAQTHKHIHTHTNMHTHLATVDHANVAQLQRNVLIAEDACSTGPPIHDV